MLVQFSVLNFHRFPVQHALKCKAMCRYLSLKGRGQNFRYFGKISFVKDKPLFLLKWLKTAIMHGKNGNNDYQGGCLKAIFHCSRFARAERTLLNFLCSCLTALTCAFCVRLNARGHAMKVELHSTFLACLGD